MSLQIFFRSRRKRQAPGSRSEIRAEMKKADRKKLSSDDADHAARWRTEAETEKENEEWLAKWRIQRHE